MTQVKTFTTWGCRIEKEGWDCIWAAPVVSRSASLQTGQAEPELSSRGWQRLLGGLSHHLGRAAGTFLGCERSSQQWYLSELHWCAFSPWPSLIFIFTRHWLGTSVYLQTHSSLFPAVPTAQSKPEGGTAGLESWSDFEILAGPLFFLACTRALEGSSEMFPRVCNGPCLLSTSAWPISRVPVQWVESWKEYTKEAVLVSPAPFLQPLRVARTAYRRISASRSEVLLHKWLRSLLNKIAGEVWCVSLMDHPWKETTQLQLWC